jgi:hypothetical protein
MTHVESAVERLYLRAMTCAGLTLRDRAATALTGWPIAVVIGIIGVMEGATAAALFAPAIRRGHEGPGTSHN